MRFSELRLVQLVDAVIQREKLSQESLADLGYVKLYSAEMKRLIELEDHVGNHGCKVNKFSEACVESLTVFRSLLLEDNHRKLVREEIEYLKNKLEDLLERK